MDLDLRANRLPLARWPSLRLGLLLAAGAGVGVLLATVPVEFALVSCLALIATAMLANLRVGFLLTGAYLLLQAPLETLLESYPDLDFPLRYSDDILIVLLAMAAAWHARNRIVRNRFLAPAMIGIALALAFGIPSALNHGSPLKAIALDAFSLSKWALLLFVAFQIEASGETILRVLRAATIVAVVLALFGYLDMLFPALTHETVPIAGPVAYRSGFRCLVSIFPNEGFSGWFFAAMACLPAARYLVLRRPADLGVAVFLLVTSFFSYRRKPVIGIAFALGVLLLSRAQLRWRSRILVAAALVAIIAFPLLGGAFRGIFQETYDQYIAPPEPMQVARNAMYIASWQISKDYFPFGAGLGLFGGHASMIEYSAFYARYGLDRVWGLASTGSSSPNFVMDVFFPHVLGALGMGGALMYVFALLFPGWKLSRAGANAREPATRIVATAALLVFFEAFAESVAAPVYEVSLTTFVVLGLAGIALSAVRSEEAAA